MTSKKFLFIIFALLSFSSPSLLANEIGFQILPLDKTELKPGYGQKIPTLKIDGKAIVTKGRVLRSSHKKNTQNYVIEVPEIYNAPRNRPTEIFLTIKLSGFLQDLDLAFGDGPSEFIEPSINFDLIDEKIRTFVLPGQYVISVYGSESEVSSYFELSVKAERNPVFKPTISEDPGAMAKNSFVLDQKQNLAAGEPLKISQVISAGDEDAYRFTVPKSGAFLTPINIELSHYYVYSEVSDDLVFDLYALTGELDDNGDEILEKIISVDDAGNSYNSYFDVSQNAAPESFKELLKDNQDYLIVVRGLNRETQANYELLVEISE